MKKGPDSLLGLFPRAVLALNLSGTECETSDFDTSRSVPQIQEKVYEGKKAAITVTAWRKLERPAGEFGDRERRLSQHRTGGRHDDSS
jgi:hypothetical protein